MTLAVGGPGTWSVMTPRKKQNQSWMLSSFWVSVNRSVCVSARDQIWVTRARNELLCVILLKSASLSLNTAVLLLCDHHCYGPQPHSRSAPLNLIALNHVWFKHKLHAAVSKNHQNKPFILRSRFLGLNKHILHLGLNFVRLKQWSAYFRTLLVLQGFSLSLVIS